jgi:hypothetical protein
VARQHVEDQVCQIAVGAGHGERRLKFAPLELKDPLLIEPALQTEPLD